MNGKDIRMGKLFSRGKAVIVAVDHGGFMGSIKGIEDLPKNINLYKKADAILLNLNMSRHCGRFFASYDSPLCVVRVNWGSHYYENFKEGYGKRITTVRQAVAFGADMVIVSLRIGGKEEASADNISLLGEIFEESESLGIPLIAEFIFVEAVGRFKGDRRIVEVGVRMCAEIGCDLIKTMYIEGFSDLVKSVPVPVLALGGAKMKTDLDALRHAKRTVQEGASGVIYGRNVFQAENPEKFLDALIKVVKEGREPEEMI